MSNDWLDQEMQEVNALEFKQMLIAATRALDEAETKINDLNVFPVPDGDTGSNMYATISNALEEVEAADTDSVGSITDELATGALMGARGNSGVILSQLLKGLSDGIGQADLLTADKLAAGLEQAANVAYQAVMKPVEGTILTVAKDVGDKAQELAGQADLVTLLREVVKEAKASVARTPELLATLQEADVVDAGGKGYQILLAGLLHGLVADELDSGSGLEDVETTQEVTETSQDYGYCTEFMINQPTIGADELRTIITEYGSSLLVAPAEEILKVHIHTDHPGQALEIGLEYGELTDIKIDNMSRQHREQIEASTTNESTEGPVKSDQLGVLAVAAGAGFQDIFSNLGADYILPGGQSMNPSIEDLLTGIEEIASQQIIILPNNKNVISTAEQVGELTDKEISVVATSSIPEGIAAMMAFDQTGELSAVSSAMKEELEFVTTGEVTYAVRDSQINDLDITEGDILGLVEGNIELVTDDYNQATLDLIANMVRAEDSLLTVYTGAEVAEADKEDLQTSLEEEYPEFDIKMYDGQQPIYYYIISVE
ncbi:DAK2 domain-containing protein [Halanaerobaculum tunisiense]